MLEIILGVACIGVLAVEVIEVRQKCEESHSGWHGASAFQAHAVSPTAVCENGFSL